MSAIWSLPAHKYAHTDALGISVRDTINLGNNTG